MYKGLRFLNLLFVFLLSACSLPEQTKNNDVSEIKDNCSVGCPIGGSQQTLYRDAYTLNNNSSTKFANWVAYKITKDSQASGKPRNWKQDPDLPPSDTLSPSAYSGAHAALKVDRGHQAPLAGLGGTSDWQTLSYLSNITPQKSDLNQGAWARLEDKERALAKKNDISAVYVVTGPLFERHVAVLPESPSVEIPSGYWKIIFTNSTPANAGNYAAFIMDQLTPRSANFCDYQVTVDSIEKKTNPSLRVWSSLPEDVARLIKNSRGSLAQEELGCPRK